MTSIDLQLPAKQSVLQSWALGVIDRHGVKVAFGGVLLFWLVVGLSLYFLL